VQVDRNEIEETGEYDLEALFIRLNHAIDSVGAKRVVLDTIETLFSGLSNDGILRSELRRLFHWLKDKGVTAIITGEQGTASLTRQGLEEYVSDCVIFLDHRIIEQISTRRLRVVKYRGTTHGTNEYPFLIDEEGITVLPVTSLGLAHPVSDERVSSGVKELDEMLGGKGYFRGSSVLVSGTAGTGKTSLSAHFVDAACRRGERCLYFAFEESPSQIIRNMQSIGINLAPWVKNGRLIFHAARPTLFGLETHLATIQKHIRDFSPDAVVIDPISNLMTVGKGVEVNSMLLRLVDLLKSRQITAFFVSLTSGGTVLEGTELGVSEIARNAAFESDSRVPADPERHPAGEPVSRAQRRPDRLVARGPGSERTGRSDHEARGRRAQKARAAAQARGVGGTDRRRPRRIHRRRDGTAQSNHRERAARTTGRAGPY
jgi:circadian clock protein KaiC